MDGQLNQSRFASALMVLAGVWLLMTPIWLSMSGAALTSILVTGAIITLAGLAQLAWKAAVPSWVAGLAAVWLFVSAFIYTMSDAATWNQVVLAVITVAIAYWDGFEMTQVHRNQHQPTHRAM